MNFSPSATAKIFASSQQPHSKAVATASPMQPNLINLPSHPSFDLFWEAYPNKQAKFTAKRAFEKAIRLTDIQTMLKAIEEQKQSDQWQRGFVPHPATWLNGGQWMNTSTPTTAPEKQGLSPMDKQMRNGEYLRVLQALNSLRDSYGAMQTWTKEDKAEYLKLRARRDELRQLLGFVR